ncbi:hypothetical protein L2E68_00610 [Planktothrix agardhii 1029]|uniref:hypothetical protein n=1 Tax=Planktothrix agardhii TaxID=1160 RepID=UPI001D0BC73E|nr:hypothetical protein [Planktothrix agardhii]MCB8779907.1 hypothetical protein [Planktothrix agardhii 1031]MCB8784333.1 hypothetical protein [Planktothrix agardhii 1808]MCF3564645.1 hypothetical protein [Planktothrix agardhii 1807]MCF3578842.1 hypothetical protein [Planktothrix agardhii 1812]MCF3588005.1 hypothetical protein [Planktothrix agardhii 1029]
MSNLTNPPGGGDPPDRFRNVGEQIQSFFDFAENNPDRAVPFFVNIWETQASLTTRALALQGLGVAAQHYHVKEALADWEVLRDIAKEVKGKGEVSNDLTRWAAASALEAIGYSQQSLEHLEGGGFTEPLDRIRREIRDRKLIEINRIQRLNTRGETTAEYERHLEFWLYGPADELLNDNDSSLNYQDLIGDVISKLHGRGVFLGLISPNRIVQGAALRQARLIFKESTEIEDYLYGLLEEFLLDSKHEISLRIHAAKIINTATDINRRLKTLSQLLLEENNPQLHEVVLHQAQSIFQQSAETEESLYQPLEEFLLNSNHEISLRIHASEIINTATDINRRLKTLSQLLLEENNPKLHEVALRQAQSIFQQSAETEESLYQPLEEFLLNSNHEISLRIHAAEIINTATDINRKLKTLSQLLLEEKELRNATVRLLTPYKEELARVEPDANKVLEVLIVDQLNKPQLKDLTISQLKNYVSSTSGYHKEISEIFTSAITASKSLGKRYGRTSSILKEVLQNKQDGHLSAIESWMQLLRNQISDTLALQETVKSSQSILDKTFYAIANIDTKLSQTIKSLPNSEVIESNYDLSYNQYTKMLSDLNLLKNKVVNELNSKSDLLLSKSTTIESETSWKLILSGLAIIVAGYVCYFTFINYSNQGSRSNSYTTTAWYASGFPKNSCGSSSSPNNCWYPVFIKYSDNNWNTVISNYCGDIGQAQSPKTARELGQIQVASFGDSNEAQGFANYMQGWVGQQKCY